MIDVVMPVDSTRTSLRLMTQQCINSLIGSEDMEFNIIVVDGNRDSEGFAGAKTIVYDFPFNYNKCLNLGISYGSAEYCVLCNNDLLFDRGWLTKTIAAMGDKYLSASPNNKLSSAVGITEGYRVEKILLGWCIVVKRKIFEKIGKLDEGVIFWYSDNTYGEQLRRAGLKHILVLHARVRHLGSRTLKLVSNKVPITIGQKKIFNLRNK